MPGGATLAYLACCAPGGATLANRASLSHRLAARLCTFASTIRARSSTLEAQVFKQAVSYCGSELPTVSDARPVHLA